MANYFGILSLLSPRRAETLTSTLHMHMRSAVNRLDEQIEGFEADVEALTSGEGRRPGEGGAPRRQEELEILLGRHRQHIIRLEQVLRLLENDQARALLSLETWSATFVFTIYVHLI